MPASSLSRYVCLICRNPIPHAGAECPHCRSRATAVVGATPSLLAAVLGTMALLVFLTYRIDAAFDNRRIERGRAHYNLAKTASDYGSYPEAIEHYREALLHIRGDSAYRRGLAVALYQAERYQEAETQLRNLRAVDPTDAVVNRLLARTSVRAGNLDEAVNFYRTAVYGRWPSDPEENRIETRFELVELLESLPGRRAVNELLAVIQEEPASRRLTRRVTTRLLENGASEDALRLLERLRRQGVSDGRLHADIARARFGVNDFQGAQASLQSALRAGTRSEELTEPTAARPRTTRREQLSHSVTTI